MRCLLTLALVLCTVTASAASLDPSRVVAIDQAADAFLTKAAEAHKTGQVPRQSDPGIGPLLDTVFDIGDLSHGVLPYADIAKLSDWLSRIVAVGRVYLKAGHAVHDIGVFGPEIGRFFDASVAVMQAIADTTTTELDTHPGARLSDGDLRKLAQLRGATGGALDELIGLFRAPGLGIGWAQERLQGLLAAAPSMARFLTPDQVARLRVKLRGLEEQVRDKKLREMFASVAVALAEPAIAPAAETSAGSAEIALESYGRSYFVPVRINGSLTVKFIVDSGASVVVLPSDLVETLTKSGALAPSDTLGRDTYITADGRKHKGTRLMLRQLEVGGHIVTNVMASAAPAKATPLLGLSFLAKFKSWTLDNQRHVLLISE
jgi:clan AA aspartic protease (TIGR02281 family)